MVSYSGEITWKQKSGKPEWAIVDMRGSDGSTDKIFLSRSQAGILFLFTILPELERDQMFDYLAKINNGTRPHKSIVSRILRLLRDHGLIVEHNKRFYQTTKGRIVWLALDAERKSKAGFFADRSAGSEGG